jgi:hypothetical protein
LRLVHRSYIKHLPNCLTYLGIACYVNQFVYPSFLRQSIDYMCVLCDFSGLNTCRTLPAILFREYENYWILEIMYLQMCYQEPWTEAHVSDFIVLNPYSKWYINIKQVRLWLEMMKYIMDQNARRSNSEQDSKYIYLLLIHVSC